VGAVHGANPDARTIVVSPGQDQGLGQVPGAEGPHSGADAATVETATEPERESRVGQEQSSPDPPNQGDGKPPS
jgi:hypothetical protein